MFYECYFPRIKKNVNIILIGRTIFSIFPLKKAGFSGKILRETFFIMANREIY